MATPKEMSVSRAIKQGQLEHTVNCCNGRVGHRMIEMAEKSRTIREYIIPTGIELVKAAVKTGLAPEHVVNCCNGRVGKKPIDNLISALGGTS